MKKKGRQKKKTFAAVFPKLEEGKKEKVESSDSADTAPSHMGDQEEGRAREQ